MPTINRLSKKSNDKNRNTEKRKLRMKIYQSETWKDIKNAHLMEYPICQICEKELAEDVHHIQSFMTNLGIDIEKAFDISNLMSVCKKCHGKIHQPKKKKKNN